VVEDYFGKKFMKPRIASAEGLVASLPAIEGNKDFEKSIR
jgi:hypothetical protein